MIDGAHYIALRILRENQDLLDKIARLLLEQEILERSELRSQLSYAKKTVEMDKWLQTGQFSQNMLSSLNEDNGGSLVNNKLPCL